jgi:hypothetical protein
VGPPPTGKKDYWHVLTPFPCRTTQPSLGERLIFVEGGATSMVGHIESKHAATQIWDSMMATFSSSHVERKNIFLVSH